MFGEWRGRVAKLWNLGFCAVLLACGETSNDAPPSARGDGGSAGLAGGRGGTGGGSVAAGGTQLSTGGASAGTGGDPSDISPDISRAWTWKECGRIPTGPSEVLLRHSPDGSTLAALSVSKQLVFHRLPLGTQEPTFAPHDVFPCNAREILFSADSSLTYELGLPIVVRNVSDGSAERTLNVVWVGQRGVVSPDGEYLLTYDAGGRGIVYRTADGTEVFSINQMLSGGFHDENVVAVGCGKPLDICTFDLGGVELERVELAAVGTLAGCIAGFECKVSMLAANDPPPAVAPGGEMVAAIEVRATGDASERFATAWSVANKRRLWSRPLGEPSSYSHVLFAAGGEVILFDSSVLRGTDGELLFSVPPSNHQYRSLAPDASTLATNEHVPTLLDAKTGGAQRLFRTHSGLSDISSLAISADGRILVTNAMEAIGFELAPDFANSKPIWAAWADGSYEVDVSADGRFATLAGDVRVLLDAA